MGTIFIIILIQLLIIAIITELFYNEESPEDQEKEKTEERQETYLKLQNMTTQEILLFKKKEDFIRDVGCYDILRNFYTDDEIIKKIYPNYKRL